MRSHEERVAETKRRIAKIEREKRLRRNTITMASAVAACLVLLIGASLAMPGIAASIQTGDYCGFETAASIFHSGVMFVIVTVLASMIAVYMKADLRSLRDLLKFVVLPALYLFNIVLFSIFYRLFSKTTDAD